MFFIPLAHGVGLLYYYLLAIVVGLGLILGITYWVYVDAKNHDIETAGGMAVFTAIGLVVTLLLATPNFLMVVLGWDDGSILQLFFWSIPGLSVIGIYLFVVRY